MARDLLSSGPLRTNWLRLAIDAAFALAIAGFCVVPPVVKTFLSRSEEERRQAVVKALKPLKFVAFIQPSTLERAPSPYLRGKVIVLDKRTETVDDFHFAELPPELRAESAEEVGTVVVLTRDLA